MALLSTATVQFLPACNNVETVCCYLSLSTKTDILVLQIWRLIIIKNVNMCFVISNITAL